MKENKINIYPKRPIYLFAIVLMILFALLFIALPFVLLIDNKPIKLFDIIPLKNGIIQFIIFIPWTFVFVSFFVKKIFFKISFNEKNLIAPRIYQIQFENLNIACEKIIACNIGFKVLYFYFVFECEDGKTREMFISHFSNKQLKKIIELIKEKGGLINQSIDDILYPIYNNKKRKIK